MKMSRGATDVVAERLRQATKEGYDDAHDDEHIDRSLALAAVCWATPVQLYVQGGNANGMTFYDPWPSTWSHSHDKRYRIGERVENPGNYVADPSTYTDAERRDLLVKAGALIIAEIDRLDRAHPLARLEIKPGDPRYVSHLDRIRGERKRKREQEGYRT